MLEYICVLAACFCVLEATQQVALFSSGYFTNSFISLFLQKCFLFGVGSPGTGGVPQTTGCGHVYECKEGMSSSIQPDLEGLKSCHLKWEESSHEKVSSKDSLWSFRG